MIIEKCVFLCLLSSKSAIGDSFVDLINNLDDSLKKDILLIKTNSYSDNFFCIDKSSIINVSINRSNISLSSLIEFIYKLRNTSKQFTIKRTIVYGISPLNHLASIIIKSKLRFFWVHDSDVHPGAHISERISNKLLKTFGLFRVASRFIVSNSHLKKRVAMWPGSKENNISIIRFPYIGAIVNSENVNTPLENNFDILFFGRIEPYKGIDSLISALSILKAKNLCYKTVIAGKGEKLELPAELGITRIDSYVPDSHLRTLISTAKVCVFPYTSATGTQAIQTALAIGTKCIVSNLPPFIEIANQVDFRGITVFENVNEFAEAINDSLQCSKWSRLEISEHALNIFSEKKFGIDTSTLIKND